MDNISNTEKSQILIDALPYIQKYSDKIVVVKYGGNAMTNKELKDAVMTDIVLLSLVGIKVVLVHGGGPEINDMFRKLNIESRFINGLRYTDKDAVDVVKMVLAGKVNKELVQLLAQHKGNAVGLCGIDGGMLTAEKKLTDDGQDLGYVGEITEVNPKPILDALNNGNIPVIATVATDNEGNTYNINADTAAARIAAELGAESLILMTDIAGLLRDKNDVNTLIPKVNVSEVPYLKMQGIVSGGMIPKIDCCVEAVRRGVNGAVIIDGRVPHSILIEIL
ncbi:MAG: acetylglutamate kinase, partial [Ruminococcus sp.]|nr:acetylglutamate kinase [Ruminococcus sp.]